MKVLYFTRSLAHQRALESFKPRDKMEQLILAPEPNITSNLVPEDYRAFRISVKTYKNISQAQSIANQFKPDVFAQTNTSKDIILTKECKRVYIGHGMIGNHVKAMGKAKTWLGFDLYCGATNTFRDWVNFSGDSNNCALNALPQFDLLHDHYYYNSHRTKVLDATKNPGAKNVVLFCGFCCKDRPDFNLHNEDYFKTAIALEKIARKNNWLIMIKPRHTFPKMIQFLKKNARWGWPTKYIKPYTDIQSSEYLHFITTNTHIYRYFFADLFVCNGCSTFEIEACLINKPLVLVRTHVDAKSYDPFKTVGAGAGTQVKDINRLEDVVTKAIIGKEHIGKQNALIKDLGIINDGKAYLRVQEALEKL